VAAHAALVVGELPRGPVDLAGIDEAQDLGERFLEAPMIPGEIRPNRGEGLFVGTHGDR
jgi:hypothetical protein